MHIAKKTKKLKQNLIEEDKIEDKDDNSDNDIAVEQDDELII